MKTLYIYLEERFLKYENQYFSIIYDDNFWERYLHSFDKIAIIARVNNIDYIPEGYNSINNSNVTFLPLPYYHGLKSGVIKSPLLVFRIFQTISKGRYHLLRLPGAISTIAGICSIFTLNKNIIAVELVGDPYDVFSTGVGGRVSKVFRCFFTGSTKKITKKADAVSYVTEHSLHKRYPAKTNAYITHYSSINLPRSIFNSDDIRKNINKEDFNILLVGSMEQRYKGFDLVIRAIGLLSFKNNIALNIVGDGIFKHELIQLAAEKGLSKNITFHGKISRNQVFNMMKCCDLFIMPSRTEGLPRALIEAMAAGSPAIGSNVGGIPELLDKKFIFESEDIEELLTLITLIYHYDDISQISRRNFLKAQEYSADILQKRRTNFYNYVISQE